MSGRIVVGIDGSEAANAALRWAHREARLHGAVLEVVHAWTFPYVGEVGGMASAVDPETLERAASHLVSSAVERELDAGAGIEVRQKVVHGEAVAALVDAATGADLLVVGSRGLGGFKGLLLGSVSQQLASHAPCPVVLVRSPHENGHPAGRR